MTETKTLNGRMDLYDALTLARENLKQTALMLDDIEGIAVSIERGEYTGELAKRAGENIGLYVNLAEQTRYEAYNLIDGIVVSAEKRDEQTTCNTNTNHG